MKNSSLSRFVYQIALTFLLFTKGINSRVIIYVIFVHLEGPDKISVFNLYTRTTGSLENYNGILGRKIIKRGHFFKFVKVLLDEEFVKCRNFYSSMRGREDKSHRANKYQVLVYFFTFIEQIFEFLFFIIPDKR